MFAIRVARTNRALGRVYATVTVTAPKVVPVWNGYQQQKTENWMYQSAAGISLLLAIGFTAAECSSPSNNESVNMKSWKVISRKEVETHNAMEKGVWVTYGDGVYDVTSFIANHPGGKEKLMSVAGKDMAASWNMFKHHKTSSLAQELLEEMKIGVLSKADIVTAAPEPHIPKYSNKPVYDVIIIGAGLSGLQCGSRLVNDYGVKPSNILVLEAQDYIGGRVKQITEFVKGAKIEVGAEFLHGNNTELTKFARAHNEPLREIYCWAHGDGGPLEEPADGCYGLYYIGKNKQQQEKVSSTAAQPKKTEESTVSSKRDYKDSAEDVKLMSKDRLLRYDDKDPDFVALNKALWDLVELNEDDYDESLSLYDYLLSKKLNTQMLEMGRGGFANTLCSNSHELSLKQAIKWSRLWHAEGPEDEEDGDYTFKNSFSCVIDHLKKDLQVELNTPIKLVQYPDSVRDGTTTDANVAVPADGFMDKVKCALMSLCPMKKSNDTDDSNESIITVTTNDGVEYRARNIVITASPHVINNKLLQFAPPLPTEIVEAYDSTLMNSIIKVIMKFEKPCWPKNLHGMIMTTDDDFLLPEMWFREVGDEVDDDEPATAYAVGFTTAEYAERLKTMSQEEVFRRSLAQMEKVFGQLEQRHMSAYGESDETAERVEDLPKASDVYLGGMFWDWQPSHHPYIGGGYCSPRAGKPITSGDILTKGYGKHMFFAGEATNDRPGATAHSALETGLRAADQVAAALNVREK